MDENKNFPNNEQDVLNQNPFDGAPKEPASTPENDPYFSNNVNNPFTAENQPFGQNPQQPYGQPNQQYQQPYGQPNQQYQQPYGQNPYQTQQYQQPYNQYNNPNYNQYAYANPQNREEKTAKNFGITSIILGVISFFCCGFISGIPGLIFGIISFRKKKQDNATAVIGIVICSIAIALSIVAVIYFVSYVLTHPDQFRSGYSYSIRY